MGYERCWYVVYTFDNSSIPSQVPKAYKRMFAYQAKVLCYIDFRLRRPINPQIETF